MNLTLNGLFDDFSEYFGKGKKSLDQEIQESLKGKNINRKEFKKDGQTIIEESYSDNSITYYSKKTFIVDDIKHLKENVEDTKEYYNEQLIKAVQNENYTLAAEIRDKLKKYV